MELFIRKLNKHTNLYITEKLENIISFEADDTILSISASDFYGNLGDLIFMMNSEIGGIVVDVKKNIENGQYHIECRNLLCYFRSAISKYSVYPEQSTNLRQFLSEFIAEINMDGTILAVIDGDIPDIPIWLNNDLHNIRNNEELTLFEFVERQMMWKGYYVFLEYRPQHVIVRVRAKKIIPPAFKKANVEWFYTPKIVVIVNAFITKDVDTLPDIFDVRVEHKELWARETPDINSRPGALLVGSYPIDAVQAGPGSRVGWGHVANNHNTGADGWWVNLDYVMPINHVENKHIKRMFVFDSEYHYGICTMRRTGYDGAVHYLVQEPVKPEQIAHDYGITKFQLAQRNNIDTDIVLPKGVPILLEPASQYDDGAAEWEANCRYIQGQMIKGHILLFNKYYHYKSEDDWNADFSGKIITDVKDFVKAKYEEYKNQFKQRKTSFKSKPTMLQQNNFVTGVVDLAEAETTQGIYCGDELVMFDGNNKFSMIVKNRYVTYDAEHGLVTKLMFNNN